MDFDWARGLSDDRWAFALAGGDSRAPPPPPAEIQSMFVGSSGIPAYEECKVFWRLTRKYLSNFGSDIRPSTRILDVGVGWGRNYRWLLRDLPPSNIVGIDVDQKAVETCRASMPYGQFIAVSPGQAYPIQDGLFDLVIAYSVFSHLSESAAKSILRLARSAMRPHAFLALTTLRPAHIEVWAQSAGTPHFRELLAANNFDRSQWWKRSAEGQHLYLPTGGGDPSRPSDSYGEAIVPKQWWENVEDFKLITFDLPNDLPQSYVILQAVQVGSGSAKWRQIEAVKRAGRAMLEATHRWTASR